MKPRVGITIEYSAWRRQPRISGSTKRAIAACVDEAVCPLPAKAEVSLLLCGDARIRELNKAWRGIDKATNVLSFPQQGPELQPLLGDIAISYETLQREARIELKSFSDHYSHMVVHGFLHLLGCDHEAKKDALLMENFERKILARLGVADPYARAPGLKAPGP